MMTGQRTSNRPTGRIPFLFSTAPMQSVKPFTWNGKPRDPPSASSLHPKVRMLTLYSDLESN